MKIGAIDVWPPVVLAPMAGVTNAAFRTLCREQGGGLYVSEMITTRGLVERNPKTLAMIRFPEGEAPRSVQLYGVDPEVVGRAVRIIAEEGLADHVDLNFGCPVPKVTRRGGGSALPYKRGLLRRVLRAAVANAGTLPVTMKMRKGIDDDHLTYLDAGRIAAQEGLSAVALHGRTAVQHYGGTADWEAIARLKDAVPEIPVLGNGDIWTADDALRMIRRTGCDGVVVGRGCLGRPWLFRDLDDAFEGRAERARPTLGEVAATMARHAALLVECFGGEAHAVLDFRKHVGWYLKGFEVGADLRRDLATAGSLEELRGHLARLPATLRWPGAAADGPRGKTNARDRVHLPVGWLDDQGDVTVSAEAELDVSGG
ncbi:tRNA dihydrouridine synthase DusB [Sphaerisporangium krabiense]|uniref:tRNA-dihydrouridine synthase n=1 Tax=Sphaerisporangium krabiense TaxID=763782 RepID=A0A7W8ZBB7_9ACTN|nr:tRNA dihydrouridine synthase DusB [Sphaerisporangium krabiense]MBB5630795.1 nifR3 family TIM-barrel protein [Sphaerisporangium krabiense]GII65522.1 tRNA dihydrouridine synthase DusB [Sphaerisporangium krabiense]